MRIGDSLQGRRVMITQSDEFMGPVLARAFADHGAVVIADPSSLAWYVAYARSRDTGGPVG